MPQRPNGRIAMLALATFILTPAAACAQSTCVQTGIAADGEAFRIDAPATSVAGAGRAAWNPDRQEYFVVWSGFDAGMWRLHGQRVAADGTLAGERLELLADPNAILEPTIAAAAGHDRYLIAWQTQSDPFNGARGIVLAGDGTTVADNFVISPSGAEPELDYVAATEQFIYSGRGAGLSAQRIDLSGALAGEPLPLATIDDGAPAPNGGIRANAQGQVLALWRNQVEERLDGRRISAAGAPVGGIVPYASDYPASGRAALVESRAGSDDYIVLYGLFDGTQVKWALVDSEGDGSAPQPVATGTDLLAIGVAHEAADGHTLLLWAHADPDLGGNALSAQLLSPSGNLVAEPTSLFEVPAYAFALAPAREHSSALLTWTGDGGLEGRFLRYGCILRDGIFIDGFESHTRVRE